jgi:alkanesulfonate monooxygenase SsuD/methylene tetrahydromethanopterin reductase-like flavin-dependent oxidoreductase (luciferase family)
VQPTPVQQLHPPVWVGAVAWKAQKRAAQLGDGWISDFMEPLARERHLADRYVSLCEEARRPPVMCLMRTCAIAPRGEELEARWLPDTVAAQLAYWRAGARSRDDDGLFARLDRAEPVPLAEFARGRLIAGAPEDCVEQTLAWQRAIHPDHLLLNLSGALSGPVDLRAAVELFGREVLPAVSGQG